MMNPARRIATAASLSCVLAGVLAAVRPIGVTAAGSSCEDLGSMPLGAGLHPSPAALDSAIRLLDQPLVLQSL